MLKVILAEIGWPSLAPIDHTVGMASILLAL